MAGTRRVSVLHGPSAHAAAICARSCRAVWRDAAEGGGDRSKRCVVYAVVTTTLQGISAALLRGALLLRQVGP